MDLLEFAEDETLVDESKPIRSWSQYSLYMRCPELFRATYIDKELKRASNIRMHMGSSVHFAHEKMAEQRIKGLPDLSLEDAKKFADKYWENGLKYLRESEMTIALERANMLGLVEAYHKYFVDSEIKPTHVEESILWYPEGYPYGLRCIIDRIDADGTITDVKTSSKSPSKSRTTGKYTVASTSGYDLQLDLYMNAMKGSLNIEPVKAQLEFVVKTSKKAPKVVVVEHEVDKYRLQSIMDLMANLEESIQKGNFPKNRLGTFCSPYFCDNWEPCTGIPREPDVLEV